jgi:hypothetical protein
MTSVAPAHRDDLSGAGTQIAVAAGLATVARVDMSDAAES